MKVLILGSGAREHALAWKLAQQNECTEIYVGPGNDGLFCEKIKPFPFAAERVLCVQKAKLMGIHLVVIGPENLLAEGYADLFREQGIPAVGPNKEAAQLETSKVFSKFFFQRAQIPTSDFQIFEDEASLVQFKRHHWPWVLKLDGLASGKGVLIARSPSDVTNFASRVWSQKDFGEGPHKILTEEFIPGREMSYIGFCDGDTFIPLATATDHKALNDGNQGPNTGGMGAISPSPFLNANLESLIINKIIHPFLLELKTQKLDFRGILFFGLMINTEGLPIVLECNTRFGDPETQCVLPRLQSSLLSLLMATAQGSLRNCSSPRWDTQSSVYVVAASEGYPNSPRSGDIISGLEEFMDSLQHTFFFSSGIRKSGNQWLTHGGRILGVGALDASLQSARERAYAALKRITWNKMHYRTDIGSVQ